MVTAMIGHPMAISVIVACCSGVSIWWCSGGLNGDGLNCEQEIRINFDSKQGKQEKLHSFYTSKSRQARVDKQETASKSRQARDGKQESSSKSRQARVDKKETGGKQETAIDEKAENTVKECTNWKDKKKDKEQEALLISEDTAFVITGENIRPKPNPGEGLVSGKGLGCLDSDVMKNRINN
ncbi:hypothetical protein Tco_0077833 [Tanacetum coccineum]